MSWSPPKPCRFFRVRQSRPDSSAATVGFCGEPAHYRDSLGRPLCDVCAAEVQLSEEGDTVFGPAGKRLLIAAVH